MPKRYLPSINTLPFVAGLIPFTPIRRPVRILVVDDDSLVGRAIVMLLIAIGHVPVSCSDPETAYRNACTEEFDLILTDYDMPGMNGVNLAKKIKRHKSTPIILMSGTASIRVIENMPDSGISLVLKKPFKLAGIDLAIKKLVPWSASRTAAIPQKAVQDFVAL